MDGKEATRIPSGPAGGSVTVLDSEAFIDGVVCRGARVMLGLSQLELCSAAACGKKLLNDFENGIRVPGPGKVLEIRRALEQLGVSFVARGKAIGAIVDPSRALQKSPRSRTLGNARALS